MAAKELLLPEKLNPLVRNTIFAGQIRHFLQAESTNTLAMQAAAEAGKNPETAPEGELFIAEEQTAGRGRNGHAWHSEPEAGIYCSFAVRPEMSPADSLWLSLISAVAVQDAVREVTGMEADIRWPNDLLLNGRKFCGILCEASSEPTRINHAVIGIGINVNHTAFTPELQALATSLLIETGKMWSRLEILASLIKSLDREYRGLLRAATNPIRTPALRFEQLQKKVEARSSYARGMRVHVDDKDGGFTGITDGLDSTGFLRVHTELGLRMVITGSVRPVGGAK